MKRVAVVLAAVLSFVPAVLGVWGNESFSEDVPVVLPASSVQIVAETEVPTSHPSTSREVDDEEEVDDSGTTGGSAGGGTPSHHPTSPSEDHSAEPAHESPGGEDASDGSGGSESSDRSDDAEAPNRPAETEAESPEH